MNDKGQQLAKTLNFNNLDFKISFKIIEFFFGGGGFFCGICEIISCCVSIFSLPVFFLSYLWHF